MCGSGGDGGYAKEQARMKAEQDAAIRRVNEVFGKGEGVPVYTSRTVQDMMPVGSYTPTYGGDSWGDIATDAQMVAVPRTVTEQTGWDTATRDKNLAGREKLYSTIMGDAEARLTDRLGKDRSQAERQVRFELARRGLMGGSADIDQGREILEKFQEGSLEARNAALGAANEARSADEKTRVNLINNIRSGMAESDALSAAFAGMQNNANSARDAAMATNIGNFFNDLSVLRGQQQFQQGMDATRNRYRTPTGATSATTGGFSGRITE
jgi:hypothetical protein